MAEEVENPFNPYMKTMVSSSKKLITTPSGMNFYVDSKYSFIKCIGEGSYGVVISVTDTTTNKKYAIKKIPNVLNDIGNGFRVYRELAIMRHCHHENILSLLQVTLDPEGPDFVDLYMTMELMDTDLCRVINSQQVLTNDHIQFFLYQLLCGLKYLHSANIIHRDLKPSNLLVNSNCDLKICDFNLARDMQDDTGLTEYVQTRWYRAPEVMLSSQQYTKAVDMWSVGCILGELLNREVLFRGNNYIYQLQLYCDLLGVPKDEDLEFITNKKGRKYIKSLNPTPKDLRVVFPTATELCLDLLQRMLVINPEKRITVEEALNHPYFDDIREEECEPLCDRVFDLNENDETLSRKELRDLFLSLSKDYE